VHPLGLPNAIVSPLPLALEPMDLKQALASYDLVLIEAAVIETLKRRAGNYMHPELANALMIYQDSGRALLRSIYLGFVEVARKANLPILICTPTWRADRDRCRRFAANGEINIDAVKFQQDLRAAYPSDDPPIFIGGLIGCKNDCYRPAQGLALPEAEDYHRWQIEHLADAGVDYLMAATLPALSEAEGIARAMSRTQLPYIISFVIGPDSRILDGISLETAITRIDRATDHHPPLGYMINCAYPTFLKPRRQSAMVLSRLVGYQANASSMSHDQLDDNPEIQRDDSDNWLGHMAELNRKYGLKLLGGCCGTHVGYLQKLTAILQTPAPAPGLR
jgi:S-methylmethionine-dependent homocysteine/selenocysteine methylase